MFSLRKHILIEVLALLPLMAAAQETSSSFNPELFYGRKLAGNYSDISASPTSISVWEMNPIHSFHAGVGSTSGENHLAMESGKILDMGFTSIGGVSLDAVNLYGIFSYNHGQHADRCWGDNFDPYNGNPYQTGSYLSGTYVEQKFDYSIKASSKLLWDHVWFGLGHDYQIGDFARTSDPRSRAQKVTVGISPSVSAKFGSHVFGFTYNFTHDKEKIGSYISKAQSGKEYYLYLQEGLGVYTQLVSTSYNRRTNSNINSLTLDYSWSSRGLSFFLSPYAKLRSDKIEDDYRLVPGNYSSTTYGVRAVADWNLTDRDLIRFDLSSEQEAGSAERIWTKTRTVVDPDTKIATVVYDIVLQMETFTRTSSDNSFSVVYNRLDKAGESPLWYAGAEFLFNNLESRNIYYSPNCKCITPSATMLLKSGGVLFQKNGRRLELSGKAGYRLGLGGEYLFNETITGREVAENVTEPDFHFLSASNLLGGMSATYRFPLVDNVNALVGMSLDERYVTSGVMNGKSRTVALLRLGVEW